MSAVLLGSYKMIRTWWVFFPIQFRAGRASYVASGYTQDEDAGARAAAIWLQAVLDFIANAYRL